MKPLTVDSTLKEIEGLIDTVLKTIPNEQKIQFLDRVNKGLGNSS